MTLKTLSEVIGEVRHEKYPNKKADGYDFHKVQSELRQSAIEWIKDMRSLKPKHPLSELCGSRETLIWISSFFGITDDDLNA